MARRKRHHTVTKAVLQGFAERGLVRAWRRDGRNHPQALGDASVVADFYTFDNDGRNDDAVETWLGEATEDDFAKLLPGLRAGAQPTASETDCLANYVGTAITRTRTARSCMQQVGHDIQGTVVLMTIAPKLGWDLRTMTASEVMRLRRICSDAWDSISPVADPASLLRTLVRQSQQARAKLANYNWSVTMTPKPAFLIGDAPVATIGTPSGGWHGLLPQGCVVCLPVSPTAILVGEPTAFAGSPSAGDLAKVVNQRTCQEAYAVVYSHPDQRWPEDLAPLHPTTPRLPEPRTSIGRTPSGTPPTFPAEYPPITDAQTAALLHHLRAADIVE